MIDSSDFNVIFQSMPIGLHGYVVKDHDDFFTIVLNSKYTYEDALKTYQHEIEHIMHNDFTRHTADKIELMAHCF